MTAETPANLLSAEYSSKAASYDALWAPLLHNFSIGLLDHLQLQNAETVIEVGCGTGGLLTDISQRVQQASVIGLDRSVGMLQQARQKWHSPLALMAADELGIVERACDFVICAFVLFHVQNPGLALEEMRRVLRPGGSLGLVVWGEDPGLPGQRIWTEELDRCHAGPDTRPDGVTNQPMMNTEDKLSALLNTAGFRSVLTWVERFEHQWNVENLLDLQSEVGAPSRRLCSLPQPRQEECLDRVLSRLTDLAPDGLMYRPQVLYATAQRPD